ncbi:MAG: type I-E CRISPR-associated protein Cas6/Cse3/CasE [Methyloprofundus sp.]|nr:type I-E CRISPR-associated protein Cas6/Cse3/CasE [Methyloprofundus sp.]
MYLHKIIPDDEYRNRQKRQFEKDAYFVHDLIWRLVSRSKSQKRDFLYRVEYDAYKNVEYLLLLATHIIPSTEAMEVVVSALYNPQISEGQFLRFKLRANPIIKRKENDKQKEYGLIIDAKHQLKKNNLQCGEDYSLDELVQEKGMNWLERKGQQHGFSVKNWDVAIGNDKEYTISSKEKKNFLIRTLDFEGKLIVTDVDLFLKALKNGIGPAKAFGCGLLSIAKI